MKHEGHPDNLVVWVECERCSEPLVDESDHRLFGDYCLNCTDSGKPIDNRTCSDPIDYQQVQRYSTRLKGAK